MPEERFSWTKQTQRRGQPPKWDLPSWLWRPEMIAERYRTGWQPPTPAPIPMDLAMAQAGEAQARGLEEFRERRGFEAQERYNLISQIGWFEAEYGVLLHRQIATETASIEELRSHLELLQRSVGGQAQLPEREQRAREIGLHKEEEARVAGRQRLESQALAKEFPEWFAIMQGQPTPAGRGQTIAQSQARQAAYGAVTKAQADVGQWRRTTYQGRLAGAGVAGGQRMLQRATVAKGAATQAWQRAGGGGRPAPNPQEMFGSWFLPKQEELVKEWKAEQYREYPQLYPWFEEAGGWGTGKSFQEWIESEPLAMGYLGAKRETEAMRRPPQMARQWQPARQR